MRILIDAFQAGPHVTGTDRVAYNMLRELQNIDAVNQYEVLVNANTEYIASALTAPNFNPIPLRIRKRALWLLLRLPFLLLRKRADVFFSFHNLSGPGFKLNKMQSVGSILDLIPLTSPEFSFDETKRLSYRIIPATMRRTAKHTQRFMAISNFTKQEAVTVLGLNPAAITTIYLQADPVFLSPQPKARLKTVKQRYKLPDNFVLAMGANDPRKNILGLLEAHRLLPDELRATYPLIVAGQSWHHKSMSISNDKHARMAGFVKDEDLSAVYKLATVFAFPSLYEGFGLPVLEAMASGTPVITSNTTSLPEVAGTAAKLVNPANTKEIADALDTILKDKPLRLRMVANGLKQVQQFSWEASARQLHALIVGAAKS